MTDNDAAAVVRLESCKANLESEFPTCERCGLAWHRAARPPACAPMNYDALRQVLLNEAAALEGSHHLIVGMRDAGIKTDPVDALRRATALRGVLIVIERCGDSKLIKAELRRLARQAERDALGDNSDDDN